MSGTYRNTIVRDGYFGFGNTARKGSASIKKLDRRAKRREAARIEREAVAEFEEDCAIAYEEAMIAHAEIEWYDDEPMSHFDSLQEWYETEERLSNQEHDYYCGYGYDDDEYYSSDYLAYDYQPKLKAPIEVEAERTGKTLGDVLFEALEGRNKFINGGFYL